MTLFAYPQREFFYSQNVIPKAYIIPHCVCLQVCIKSLIFIHVFIRTGSNQYKKLYMSSIVLYPVFYEYKNVQSKD